MSFGTQPQYQRPEDALTPEQQALRSRIQQWATTRLEDPNFQAYGPDYINRAYGQVQQQAGDAFGQFRNRLAQQMAQRGLSSSSIWGSSQANLDRRQGETLTNAYNQLQQRNAEETLGARERAAGMLSAISAGDLDRAMSLYGADQQRAQQNQGGLWNLVGTGLGYLAGGPLGGAIGGGISNLFGGGQKTPQFGLPGRVGPNNPWRY